MRGRGQWSVVGVQGSVRLSPSGHVGPPWQGRSCYFCEVAFATKHESLRFKFAATSPGKQRLPAA